MAKSVSGHSVEDLATALEAARKRGQQIVPIVGAGLSAECGFPVIAAVVRYFGKLSHYISLRGPLYQDSTADIFSHHFRRYEAQPWGFLEDFGWPDWFQLNEDLFTKLKVKNGDERVRSHIESAEQEGLEKLLRNLNPNGVDSYSTFRATIEQTLTELEKQHLSKPTELQAAVDDSYRKFNSRFDAIGDWRRLILYFTNYRSDYADALFAKFGATRKPGQGHRFLAFLSKILAVRTILTFNFDSLIEEGMEAEGVRCKVFAMERGAGLPYQNLLRDQLSIIKAHGSTHALLLDEQLDRPLSPEYLKRFDEITGGNPMLLVVGCSAGDRRLRDLVLKVMADSRRGRSSDPQKPPSVAWLHYELDPPEFLDNKKFRRETLTLRTNNPGATLVHLYSWLMNSNPASRVPYLAHVQQPIELASAPKKSDSSTQATSKENPKTQFDWIPVTGSKFLTASQILLKRANEMARKNYQFIWIDLESLHTFAGVIGSIIDQCRKFDSDLVPSLLPVDIDRIGDDVPVDEAFLEEVIRSAAKRVARALRRARYYLAIDGLGSYPWPATTHHGLTHMANTSGTERRLENMAWFLELLEAEDLGESRVGVGLDELTSRFKGRKLPKASRFKKLFSKAAAPQDEPESFKFQDYFLRLREDLPIFCLKKIPAQLEEILPKAPNEADDDYKQRTQALIAMMLFSLSCFRRTRPLVATTYLLEPLFGKKFKRETLQQILSLFTEQGHLAILQQLEGGSYWFNHSIRDELYAQSTEYTDTDVLRRCLDQQVVEGANCDDLRNTVFQLFLSAITHHRISKIWYNLTFVQSRDTFAFLEYTYHRISSIRNLVKLLALARVGTTKKAIAEGLVSGIAKCAELLRLLGENEPPFKQLEFGDDGPFLDLRGNHRETDPSGRDWCSEAAQLLECLKRRHRRQLHGLYRGWTRAELTLRTQVPAEQLLHWCGELLSDDLIHRCNRLVIDYRGSKPRYYNFGEGTKHDYLIDPELENEKGDLKEFRRFLQDLQVKLWIERSDYDTCIRHRRKHLWHSLGKRKRAKLRKADSCFTQIRNGHPIKEEIENQQVLIDECEVRQCHQLLNIANCSLKLQQEKTCDEDELTTATNSVLGLLAKIKTRLQDLSPPNPGVNSAESNDHNEAWLRMLNLEADARMRHVSMFSHEGFTGDPQQWKLPPEDLREAQKTIEQGLDEIGGRDVHTRAAPRSVILHPTADASLYLQFRSVFNIYKGRLEWLIDPENKADGLKKCLHSFEMARGGLDNDSSLISALIEIYWTEALLARGRTILFERRSGDEFREAQEVYDSAHGAVRRARESLLVSHRHLMWRKLFFRITTQYYSDRLLLRYAKLQEKALSVTAKGIDSQAKQDFEVNAREALLRLRRAYQTLVSALDLYLPLSKKFDPSHSKRFRWLTRMWWELTLCGYATGRVVITAVRGTRITEDHAHEYLVQQLKWLNKADGVDESALKEVFEKNYDWLQCEYQSLENIEGPDHLTTALNRRRKMIERANELSAQL